MAKKETSYYNRQLQKAGDQVKRPNEVIKRDAKNGNMKLTFKSPDFYERDLVVTNKALLSQSQKSSPTKEMIVDSSGTTMDLSGYDTFVLTLTTGTTITDVSNFQNGKTYKVFIVQDENGDHSFDFDESLSQLTTFGNITVNQASESVTLLNFICANDKVFVEGEEDYNKI